MSEFLARSILGTRGSLTLDLVSLVLAGILLGLVASIYQVKVRRQYARHKRNQLILGGVLALVVVLFEIDIRFMTDWQARAEPSPYFQPGRWNLVWYCLVAHLACAIPTTGLWIVGIVQALRHFPQPPVPGSYSRRHRMWGWSATGGTLFTALTGWLFYGLAFVAV